MSSLQKLVILHKVVYTLCDVIKQLKETIEDTFVYYSPGHHTVTDNNAEIHYVNCNEDII